MSLQARRFEQSVVVPIEDIERLLAAPPRRPVPRPVPVGKVPAQATPVRAVAKPVTPAPEPKRAPVPVLTARRRPWVAIGGGALLLVGAVVATALWSGGAELTPPAPSGPDPRLAVALQDSADAREEAQQLAGELELLRQELETLRAAQPTQVSPARTAKAAPAAKAKKKRRARARPRRVARARKVEAPRSRAVKRAPPPAAPRAAAAASRAPAKKERKQAPATAGDKGLEALLDGL